MYFNCYFGDNKIFIINNEPKRFVIGVYYLNNSNSIFPEIFYDYNGKNELETSLSLIKEKGYFQYTNHYLIFGRLYS